jgi:hypothetical protein
MPQLKDMPDEGRFVGCFMSIPGKGKSIAAASFPKPMLIIDMDGRIRSVLRFYQRFFPAELEGIEYETITQFVRMSERWKKLLESCPYKTLIHDGLTMTGDVILDYTLSRRGLDRDGGEKLGIIDVPDLPDYKAESKVLKDILIAIERLPKVHFILTAHIMKVEVQKFQKGGTVTEIHESLLTGGRKVGALLGGRFDEIYRFETAASANVAKASVPAYVCRTQMIGESPVKTTLPLPPTIDWTGKLFFKVLQEQLKPAGKQLNE